MTALKSDMKAFEQRRSHAYEKIKWHVPDQLKSGRFLDIGCGTGNGLIAAIQSGFREAVGIDRDLNEFETHDAREFPDICDMYGVDPSRVRLLAADLLSFRAEPFDVVFLLDSIEHVPDPMQFISIAADLVAPGGVLLIDTCPLYYSKVGHHLWDYFPGDAEPWAHLRPDFDELCARHGVSSWSRQRFDELNKVTHEEIRDRVLSCGLSICHEHRSGETPEARIDFGRVRPYLRLDGIEEHLLFEDWILIVARKPALRQLWRLFDRGASSKAL